MLQLLASLAQAQSFVPLTNAFAGAAPAAIPDILREAEENYLHPAVGTDLCAALAEPTSTVPEAAALLVLLQRAVAHFAVAAYLPKAAVQVTPNGLVQVAGDKQKKADAEAVEALRRSLVKTGYHNVEKALVFLEKNAQQFPQWAGSEAYTLAHESLCVSASVFNQYVFIGGSRRLFLAIRPSLAEVEHVSILPTLTGAVYEQLRSAPQNGQAPDVLRRRHVLPALSNLAFAQALPSLMLIPDYGTLLTYDSVQHTGRTLRSASPEAVHDLAAHHHALGMAALDRIAPFMQAAPTAFPNYPALPAADAYDYGIALSKNNSVAGFL
jgi:hypothetical protein